MSDVRRRVEKLKERIDTQRIGRALSMEGARVSRERVREVNDAYPYIIRYDFWCDHCKEDIVTRAWKDARASSGRLPIARYVGYCPKCQRQVYRHITEKHLDPYYHRSLKIRKERILLADAMLQPHEPRFRLVYQDAWADIVAQRKAEEEAKEQQEYARKQQRR
jgi:hypothetical protein